MDKDQDVADIIDIPSDFGQEAPASEPAPNAEAPADSGQPRDPATGKFSSKQTDAPTETGVTPPATPPVAPTSQPEPGHVPIAALLDTRDKLSTAKRELEQTRERLAEFERQRTEQPADLFIDPQAWEKQNQSIHAKALTNVHLNTSELIARGAFGEDKVDQAIEWAKSNLGPADTVRIQNSRHPYAELIRIKDERDVISTVGNDPAAYRTKLEAEIRAQIQAETKTTPPVQPQAAPVNTPPSMAAVAQGSAASSSTASVTDPKQQFDEMFNR